MKRVNTHGLKINNLRRVCGETGGWPANSGGYDEIFYNRETGDLWTVPQVSLGRSSWTEYPNNPEVVKVGETSQHMTMQEIADAVARAVAAQDTRRAQWEENRRNMEAIARAMGAAV